MNHVQCSREQMLIKSTEILSTELSAMHTVSNDIHGDLRQQVLRRSKSFSNPDGRNMSGNTGELPVCVACQDERPNRSELRRSKSFSCSDAIDASGILGEIVVCVVLPAPSYYKRIFSGDSTAADAERKRTLRSARRAHHNFQVGLLISMHKNSEC